MRAVIARSAGPPSVLEVVELPDPVPGPGQVLVEVRLAAVNFVDTQMRSGIQPLYNGSFPIVFGNGVAGTVAGMTGNVVTGLGGSGGYAERAVAAEPDLHRVPAGLDPAVALALLADGRTALGLFDAAQIERGDTVVVSAASSGVGTLLVQLATHAGATVVGLASSDAKLAHVRGVGADVVINYTEHGWAELFIEATPDGVDVVFDGVGGDTTRVLFDSSSKGARYLLHGRASGRWGSIDAEMADRHGIELIPLTAIAPMREQGYELTERALAMAVEGTLTPTIGQTFPLERAADAHTAIESRATIGRTLLVV